MIGQGVLNETNHEIQVQIRRSFESMNLSASEMIGYIIPVEAAATNLARTSSDLACIPPTRFTRVNRDGCCWRPYITGLNVGRSQRQMSLRLTSRRTAAQDPSGAYDIKSEMQNPIKSERFK